MLRETTTACTKAQNLNAIQVSVVASMDDAPGIASLHDSLGIYQDTEIGSQHRRQTNHLQTISANDRECQQYSSILDAQSYHNLFNKQMDQVKISYNNNPCDTASNNGHGQLGYPIPGIGQHLASAQIGLQNSQPSTAD